MHNRDIEKPYREACKAARTLIIERARAIMRRHPNVIEFVNAMGMWSFTTNDGNDILDDKYMPKYVEPVAKIYWEWDEYLRLTGDPMRFTVDGPVITDW